jgi:tetratricopeptide (TPR) repeat protein
MSRIRSFVVLILSIADIFIAAPVMVSASKVDIEGDVVTGHRMDRPALVRLLSGQKAIQQTIADTRGRFRFRKIDPGSYVIHVECDGYYGQDVPVQVAGSTQHVSITLQAAPDELAFSPAFDPFRELDIPPRARKEFDLGIREQKAGQCARAISHLQKAVAMYPRYGEAFNEMGRCYLQMEDAAAAEESFKRAIQFGTGIVPAVNLATVYVNQGRLDEAFELITRLLRQNPTEGELYAALARIHFARGRVHEAEVAALEAHSRGHQSPDVHLILAKIYESQHNRAGRITQLRTYLDESPRGSTADQVRKQLQEIQGSP